MTGQVPARWWGAAALHSTVLLQHTHIRGLSNAIMSCTERHSLLFPKGQRERGLEGSWGRFYPVASIWGVGITQRKVLAVRPEKMIN